MALLDAAPALKARLLAVCPAVGDNVFVTSDLSGVKEKSQVTPALHVVVHSYAPADNASDASLWQEIYLVVAVVKNARQQAGSGAIAGDAAQVLKEALAALDGWRCPGAVGPVKAIQPPQPLITDSHGYFPLAFSVRTVTEGAAADDL